MSRAQIRITAPPAGWPFHPREHSSPTVCPDLDLRVQQVFAAPARCPPAPPLPREAPREPAASRVPRDTLAVGCGGGRPFRGLHSTCILVPPPGMRFLHPSNSPGVSFGAGPWQRLISGVQPGMSVPSSLLRATHMGTGVWMYSLSLSTTEMPVCSFLACITLLPLTK